MTYKELKELLILASEKYYKNSESIMSDYEFDIKMKELEKMEREQGYVDNDSPTIKIGSDLNSLKNTSVHSRPMLSLENTYNLDEVEKWYFDMLKLSKKEKLTIVVNPKWDGGSCAIRIDNGVLKAFTRGDGIKGEDITQNVSLLNLDVNKKFNGEVRGELILTKDGFNKLNYDGKYQNARNLLSGSMKLLDPTEFSVRSPYIKFYAYWAENSFEENKKYSDDLKKLKENNFTVGDYYICNSIDEIKNAIEKIEKDKNDYPVEIDGAVLKIDDKELWDIIGSTAKAPRWARAYKYKQETVTTKVDNIEFWVGRTGKITPVIWFEPRFLDGSTIQKATLNNKDFYETMDIAIGDVIEVQKAAAIIPQIVNVQHRNDNRRVIPFPKTCPSCGEILTKKSEEHNDVYCMNKNCTEVIINKFVHFTHSLEIDGFADIVVRRLFENKILGNDIFSIYELKNHIVKASKLERLSTTLMEKLCANIENSKNGEVWKLLNGLGIPNVGPKTSKTLIKKYGSIKKISELTLTELTSVDDIGEIVAESIVNFFKDNSDIVNKLEKYNVKTSEGSHNNSSKLLNKKICITGKLTKPREEYIKIIEDNGGSVVSSVSVKTDFLINNDTNSSSSKNKKAKELNIMIISEAEFLKMLKE